ncbi:secretion-associated RAS super family 2 [Actinidia rufa]|uniref:Secretion-associated RAS super family 2 n=1 Tax=Actinidia rufa TaxID=165716 RepID=A0A7J0F8F0_9ERIC|nr:secretion-associated RAS super family 2 [Actinidia rufa]
MFLLDWFYGVLASLGLWQKEAKILFLGLDNAGKTTLLHMLKDERLVQHQPTQYPTSEELSIGQIKFKAFDLGGHQIARRVWKDYYAKGPSSGAKGLRARRSRELGGDHCPSKAGVPSTVNQTPAQGRPSLLTSDSPSEVQNSSSLLLMFPAVLGKIPFSQPQPVLLFSGWMLLCTWWTLTTRRDLPSLKKELDALLSDESLATVPFLILGNKIDIPYAASEDELRYHMGLSGVTTGKGKVNLADSAVRPLEVFMCSIVRKMGYGDGFKWVSQYIK